MSAFDQPGNYVLGAGRILFAAAGSDEYRYIVETPEFTINVTTEVVDLWGSDTKIAQKKASSEVQRDYAASFSAHDVDPDNLAIFFGGEVSTVENSTEASIADYEIAAARQGYSYRIGKTASNPRGVRGVSAVVVTGTGGTPSYAVGDDYEVDASRGLITIVEGGGIADGTLLEVSCDVDDGEYTQVASTGAETARGSLLFVAENTDGDNIDYEFPNVILRADGDLALKSRTDYQGMSFAVEISEDDSGKAVYVETPFIPA